MRLWPWLRHRRQRQEELDAEIQAHLRMAAQDRIDRGETDVRARQAALREFGNAALVKEATREVWGWASLDRLGQDLRYGARMLRRNPGFTAVVALTLALGIGANTAIFSVIQAALSPLPIAHPDRVVVAWTESPKRDWHQFPASIPDFLDWKGSGAFSSLAALAESGFNLRLGGRTERVDGILVTREFFDVMGIRPQLGRFLREDDMQPGKPKVIVLTDRLWRSRFGADPAIVGRSVVLDGSPCIVAGVLSRSFRIAGEDIYGPLVSNQAALDRGARSFFVVGRLRDGLSLDAAQKIVTDVGQRLAREHPEEDGDISVALQRVEEAYVEDARTLLLILFGAVGFVLLIACANIANLLLARGSARWREMTIRAALGATRWRMGRQLLTESLLMSLLGGLLAIPPALWGIHFINSFHLDELPNSDLIAPNLGVLVFNLVLSLATGVLCGLAPVWQVRRAALHDALKTAGRTQTEGARQRLRGLFVVAEVALTLVLLAGAGLMLQSFLRLRFLNPGYNPHGLLTMRIDLAGNRYADPEKQAAFFRQVLERARALPSVRAAGAVDDLPTPDNVHGAGLYLPGRPEPLPAEVPIVQLDVVSPDYFRAMQIPLLRGRYLNESDRRKAPLVALIDELAAKRYWPHETAVGQRLKLGKSEPVMEVVGVVGTVDLGPGASIFKTRPGQVYVPMAQSPRAAMTLVVRPGGREAEALSGIRDIVRGLDADQAIFQVRSMDEVRAAGRATQRMAAWLLGSFGTLALLLAAMGIYGVMSYQVGQRTREFGIRISLGAQPGDILRLAGRQAMLLAAIGIAAGLAGALALTRLMKDLLFEVGATDPLTMAGVAILLGAATLLAGYVPARRATEIQPTVALRE